MQSGRLIQIVTCAFGMHDAATPLSSGYRTLLDGLHEAEIIAMHDFALKQIGDRRDTNMRVRADLNPFTGRNSAGPI